eukprot:505581-Rhodomonas_salina.1
MPPLLCPCVKPLIHARKYPFAHSSGHQINPCLSSSPAPYPKPSSCLRLYCCSRLVQHNILIGLGERLWMLGTAKLTLARGVMVGRLGGNEEGKEKRGGGRRAEAEREKE